MTFKEKKGLEHNMDSKKLIHKMKQKNHFSLKKYEEASNHKHISK